MNIMRLYGYPHYYVVYRKKVVLLCSALSFTSIAGIVMIVLAFAWIPGAKPYIGFCSAGVAILLLAFWLAIGYVITVNNIRILLYFDKEVYDESNTFLLGRKIAINVKQLDEIARNVGVMPLSAFGFYDDLKGDALVWHDPSEGIKTFVGLIDFIRRQTPLLSDSDILIVELDAMAKRLRQASLGGAHFCLQLRYGSRWDAHEMSIRKGFY